MTGCGICWTGATQQGDMRSLRLALSFTGLSTLQLQTPQQVTASPRLAPGSSLLQLRHAKTTFSENVPDSQVLAHPVAASAPKRLVESCASGSLTPERFSSEVLSDRDSYIWGPCPFSHWLLAPARQARHLCSACGNLCVSARCSGGLFLHLGAAPRKTVGVVLHIIVLLCCMSIS